MPIKMFGSNLFFFLFAISTHFWITNALNAEHVKGGRPADPSNFRYHVTIMGKQNFSDQLVVLCAGGLIREDLALSSATCFLQQNGGLKEYRFLVAVGTSDVFSNNGRKIWIDVIYVPRYHDGLELYDISIPKLDGRLTFGWDSSYSKLNIPMVANLFDGLGALLAGTECADARTNNTLKYVQVEILDEENCELVAPNLADRMDRLGLKFAKFIKGTFDLCESDEGSPLVIGTQVVGLAHQVFPRSGAGNLVLYTDAYATSEFIDYMLKESNPTDTRAFIYPNNIHIS